MKTDFEEISYRYQIGWIQILVVPIATIMFLFGAAAGVYQYIADKSTVLELAAVLIVAGILSWITMVTHPRHMRSDKILVLGKSEAIFPQSIAGETNRVFPYSTFISLKESKDGEGVTDLRILTETSKLFIYKNYFANGREYSDFKEQIEVRMIASRLK